VRIVEVMGFTEFFSAPEWHGWTRRFYRRLGTFTVFVRLLAVAAALVHCEPHIDLKTVNRQKEWEK
jgi:hypothetical protein